ncbi:ubiquinone/menaquinone biosynthesis C-methylase UbiE [Paraburkholderia sp. RAU2J]|uniref:class I SAM-dependent methyltransferase n=1 Tax=Paraburkholderia sp. RAU2J TaxID=1938810 RepID=UPI000EAD45DE|nr:methyltransferase domain-containing protein [Paraburkholderia sp. RAU2J]RKT10549.1 ubiquinone/menaquinone biosynthesis C-methylase UbiE [Paraburkholderia sp. RAU2J]RKT20778.1 ubiquinone/menaquinone biosynthesis C-methylase UbiE [Paraburkholderia sp. RAU2J]
MTLKHQTENEQTALWNGSAGRAWVAEQEVLDRMFKPFEDLLVEMMGGDGGHCVLDVGCGTGSTTLALARRLGVKGHCIGVDVSTPMLATAHARAEREGSTASFIRADAQTYAFDPQSFDRIMSRFGVMFFDNPVQAFANLRRAARDDAELRFIAWRSAAENPFMTTAERVAAPLLPNLPVRKPDAPGQFSFAKRSRVTSILEDSGWAEIDIRSVDVGCIMPETELIGYLTRLGPVGLILHDADEGTRKQIIETVRTAFDPYVHGTEVRFTAACWLVSARAGLRHSR